jgi:hypothetical protein
VPASMPFEARFRDMNNGIHTAKDTLDRSNQNAEHAGKFARLATAYAIELAKGESSTMSAATKRSCSDSAFTWFAGLTSLALAFVLWFRTSRVA